MAPEGLSMIQRAARMRRGPAATEVPAASETARASLPTKPVVLASALVGNFTDALASCKSNAGGIQLEACAGMVDPLGLAGSSSDTGGYERLGADELAILREDSMGHLEGISMIQESAKLERVGVANLGSLPSKPKEPIAWEPVDADLDIMALIDEEEGISMVQTNVVAVHRASKAHAERRPSELGGLESDAPGDEASQSIAANPDDDGKFDTNGFQEASGAQEGYSLLQVSAQYRYRQTVA